MSSPSHILVVDDSPTQLRQFQMVLEKEGYSVKSAADGKLALDAILADPPSLVVTDLQMPEMNGLELVSAVQENAPQIPVILTTSQGSEAIAAEALQKGAASYAEAGHAFHARSHGAAGAVGQSGRTSGPRRR